MRKRTWTSLVLGGLLSALVLGLLPGRSAALQVGDKAPGFALPASRGEKIELASYQGKQPIVLFFYIGAFTNL